MVHNGAKKMKKIKTIKICCTGSELIELDDLKELQGNLKDLSDYNYTRLKESILEYGFSFPVFVWKKGKVNYIMDAHQRVKTLKKLRDEEEFIIPKIPVVFVQAKDKREAKEKLLQLNSNYGKITQEGLSEFFNEPGFELDFEKLKDKIDLPDFDMDLFDLDVEDYTDLDKQMDEDLKGMEKYEILIEIPAKHKKKIEEFLANGENKNARGFGKGLIKRCELL